MKYQYFSKYTNRWVDFRFEPTEWERSIIVNKLKYKIRIKP